MGQFSKEWADECERKRRAQKQPQPQEGTGGESLESKIHNDIIQACRDRGFIYFHGSMAHKTYRTVGEADFCCLLPGGVVLFVECKSATGKLSPQQLALKLWMEKLGHTLHIVRCKSDFITLCEQFSNTKG